jgi:uncharacterized protein YdeI (YjbR/CyaY-like superfamily)
MTTNDAAPFRDDAEARRIPDPHARHSMPKTDKRVDAYIATAPDYARPILTRVREMVHQGAPDCEETLKWSHPAFMQNGILCGMAAFKEYCAVSFWKAVLIMGERARPTDPAGVFGKILSVKDLPLKHEFVGYVKRAVELNASGAKVPRAPAKPKKALETPGDLRKAIAKSAKARAAFDAFSPSHKREYVEWIVEAKQEATRKRRIAQAVEWMAEGKARNWKYMK